MSKPDELLSYKRNHFSARFPVRYLYSASHFWLEEESKGVWKVGLTNFATRMLGEIVEYDLEKKNAKVTMGETIGWIEGFKAVSDLISIADGEIIEINADAQDDCEIVCKKPYTDGWLYKFRGTPDDSITDVHGYISHLDLTIDKMLDQPWKSQQLSDAPETNSQGDSAAECASEDNAASEDAAEGDENSPPRRTE